MISQPESDELFIIPFLIRLRLAPELTRSKGKPGEPLLQDQGLLMLYLAFLLERSTLLHSKSVSCLDCSVSLSLVSNVYNIIFTGLFGCQHSKVFKLHAKYSSRLCKNSSPP